MRGRRARGVRLWTWISGLLVAVAVLGVGVRLEAQDVTVPISLQMSLLLKVASYDKNLKARAHDKVRVLVLIKHDDAESGRSAAQALKAVSEAEAIDGMPVEGTSTTYGDPASLARLTNENNLAILYVTPGFSEGEIEAIARALDGVSVLSAGAVAKYTFRGLVLGFDLAGGKPKLLVHLERAKRQRVELSSSVLKLMRVIE
jgi:uncharacterized protein DUF4154